MSARSSPESPKTAAIRRFSWQTLSQFLEALAPLIFPPACVLCGEATGLTTGNSSARRYATFCRGCETSLIQSQPMMRTACDRCGWPRVPRSPRLSSQHRSSASEDHLGNDSEITSNPTRWLPCPKCQALPHPHRFSQITPLYRYHDAARTAVVAAKYPRNSTICRELAIRLADRCRSRWPELHTPVPGAVPTIVTSVPSPWIRQIRRGGSGTRLLAQYTAKNLDIPYRGLLETTRPVAKQALLNDDERRQNVTGAFQLARRWRKVALECDVVLVDDVMTTGATADEVAGVLLQAGARRVSLAVVALAMRDS